MFTFILKILFFTFIIINISFMFYFYVLLLQLRFLFISLFFMFVLFLKNEQTGKWRNMLRYYKNTIQDILINQERKVQNESIYFRSV